MYRFDLSGQRLFQEEQPHPEPPRHHALVEARSRRRSWQPLRRALGARLIMLGQWLAGEPSWGREALSPVAREKVGRPSAS